MEERDDSIKFYRVETSGEFVSKCRFTGLMIGSPECRVCSFYMARNLKKSYVRCKQFRDEGRDYHKLKRPVGVAGGSLNGK